MAASAASVVAMAGDEVLISPVGHILIHNPSTIAIGESEEMRKAKQLLNSLKESIINAYEIKTSLSRAKISHMMNVETDMSAQIAVALGFVDDILYQSEGTLSKPQISNHLFSSQAVFNSLLDKIRQEEKPVPGILIPRQNDSIVSKQIWTEVS